MPNNNILVVYGENEKVLDQKYTNGSLNVEIYKSDADKEDGCAIECEIHSNQALLFSVGKTNRKIIEREGIAEMFFNDPKVFSTFAAGSSISKDVTYARFDRECKLFTEGNPYSKYSIFDQRDGKFAGRIILEDCDEPHPISKTDMAGFAEIGIAIKSTKQRTGLGTDSITGITYGLAAYLVGYRNEINMAPPYLIKHKIENGNDFQLCDLQCLFATAAPDNGTFKIFNKGGYRLVQQYTHEVYKKERGEFQLPVQDIIDTCKRSKLIFK